MTQIITLMLFVFVSHHSAPHGHVFSLMGYMTNKITQIGTSGKGMVILMGWLASAYHHLHTSRWPLINSTFMLRAVSWFSLALQSLNFRFLYYAFDKRCKSDTGNDIWFTTLIRGSIILITSLKQNCATPTSGKLFRAVFFIIRHVCHLGVNYQVKLTILSNFSLSMNSSSDVIISFATLKTFCFFFCSFSSSVSSTSGSLSELLPAIENLHSNIKSQIINRKNLS